MSSVLSHHCNPCFITELNELVDMNVLLLMVDGSAAYGRLATTSTRNVLRLVQPVGAQFPPNVRNGVVFHPANPEANPPLILAQILIDACDIAVVIWGTFPFVPLLAGEEEEEENGCGCWNHGEGNGFNPPYGAGMGTAGAGFNYANAGGYFNVPFGPRDDKEDTASSQTRPSNYNMNNNTNFNCALINDLQSLIVRNIGLVTLGGWTVAGQLGQVANGMALVTPSTANIPPIFTQGMLTVAGPAIPDGYLQLPHSVSAWVNLAVLTQVLQP